MNRLLALARALDDLHGYPIDAYALEAAAALRECEALLREIDMRNLPLNLGLVGRIRAMIIVDTK